MNNSFSIHHLQKDLNQSDKHVLIDNLNLHHKSWEDNQINREHRMIADLLKHVKQNNLILTTSTDMITCNLHESKIIIDLTFIFSTVHDQLIHCQEMTELNKISDYKSIKTFFYSHVKTEKTFKHRSWKKADAEAVKKISNIFWISRYLSSLTEVEQYAAYFLQFTENLMKKTVLWIKNERKTISWWSANVAETVKKYRNALWSDWSEKKIKRIRRKYNKAVHLVKTEYFRSILYSIIFNLSLMWKLVKWDCIFSLISFSHSVILSLKIKITNQMTDMSRERI